MDEEKLAICDWGSLTKALSAQEGGWTVDRPSERFVCEVILKNGRTWPDTG
jgi:hypothetical protein